MEVDPLILEGSLQFSIQSRMAPLWNRVGRYFLQGRSFLHSSSVQAIQPQLRFNSQNEVTLVLRGGRLKFPKITLEHFDIEKLVSDRFLEKIIDTIGIRYLGDRHVYVLPSLTRATVISITRSLLESDNIRSWKDMKRYWKNMYGFRLSDDDATQPEFYVNVVFGSNDLHSTVFSYPCWCVRPCEPFAMPRVDPVPIVEAFLSDMTEKVNLVGGQQLHFPNRRLPQQPSFGLLMATEDEKRS